MENKVVCDYCGTIYDGSREKCPLCGSTTRAEAAPAALNPIAVAGVALGAVVLLGAALYFVFARRRA